ncbi:MAG: ABC transporter ATP-binding protein [Proteobacteria bacterium]|nr:ABC transporter ATP-binding protein [Pseudomonadota bacterium]
MAADVLIDVRDISTSFTSELGAVQAVADVSFTIRSGETLALVGESGSGKSVTSLSIMRLLPAGIGRITAGSVLLRRKSGATVNLAALPEAELRAIRGDDIAMIFQEPMTSLNPLYPVGDQIAEVVQAHRGIRRDQAWRIAEAMLARVGIPDPARRANDYPHQLSGGMRQRVMIAMALVCEPALLIADEPTTALDVTIQAQIVALLRSLQRETAKSGRAPMSVLFITHNLGVVAETADRIAVMYAGRIIEEGPVADVFARPRHPYTAGLLASVPKIQPGTAPRRQRLSAIPGQVPGPHAQPPGCAFAPRCARRADACEVAMPPLATLPDSRRSRCLRWAEL